MTDEEQTWLSHTPGLTDPARAQAEAFLRALPADLPRPELAADPDGRVSLDWGGSGWMFSISVVGTRLAYAWVARTGSPGWFWLDGGGSRMVYIGPEDSSSRMACPEPGYSGHGVASFDAGVIPSALLGILRSLLAERTD